MLKPRLIKSRKTHYTDCKKTDKSIDHIMNGCTKLAQEYKRRHDNLGKIIHWKLARKCNFEAGDEWYVLILYLTNINIISN